jgi:hypothetical protein
MNSSIVELFRHHITLPQKLHYHLNAKRPEQAPAFLAINPMPLLQEVPDLRNDTLGVRSEPLAQLGLVPLLDENIRDTDTKHARAELVV